MDFRYARSLRLTAAPMRRGPLLVLLGALVMMAWGAPAVAQAQAPATVEGRVVDADTGEPVEGVAIAAVWGTFGTTRA